jgi:hypothetical protein
MLKASTAKLQWIHCAEPVGVTLIKARHPTHGDVATSSTPAKRLDSPLQSLDEPCAENDATSGIFGQLCCAQPSSLILSDAIHLHPFVPRQR